MIIVRKEIACTEETEHLQKDVIGHFYSIESFPATRQKIQKQEVNESERVAECEETEK